MTTRHDYSQRLIDLHLHHVDRAIAFLWFYRHTQEFEDRLASELSDDMSEDGFPKAHVTRLNGDLLRSRYVVRGVRPNSFRINIRYLDELNQRYLPFVEAQLPPIQDNFLPSAFVSGTGAYLEQIVREINGCYQFGFYDGCAVLLRRLIESLIIEVYVHNRRANEIRDQNSFFMLDRLINFIVADRTIVLARNTPAAMQEIKQLGDTAAHDRNYITPQIDINDIRYSYRRIIQELLVLSGKR